MTTTRARSSSSVRADMHSLIDDHQTLGNRKTAQKGLQAQKKTKTASQSSGISSDEESAEDGSDEADDDEAGDDDDEPDSMVPSRGHKYPAKTHGAGLDTPANGKKRRYSRVSTDSGLRSDGEDTVCTKSGPRRKRSNTGGKGDRTETEATTDDDEAYQGVDLISDSDNDSDVERLEEKVIIDSEEALKGGLATRGAHRQRRTSTSTASSDWGDFDLDGGLFLDNVPFFDEQFGRFDFNVANDFDAMNAPTTSDGESGAGVASRRVRFQEEPREYSDSTSTVGSEEDESIFPDLFMQQERLGPGFRLVTDNDQDADDDGSTVTDGEGSYWDFRQSDREIETSHDESSEADESYDEDDVYASEEGDTTDEDLPPPATIARPRSVLRRVSSSSSGSGSETTPVPFRRAIATPTSRRVGPSMGSWVADPSKPIAVIDSTGKRMVIYPARIPTKKDANLFGIVGNGSMRTSPGTPFQSLGEDSDNDRSDFSQDLTSPIVGSGANLMMGGLLHGEPGSEYLLGGQVLGPPEAFYPFKSVGSDGQIMEEEEDDDIEDEDLWNVHDFIDFGDGSTDSEGEENHDGLVTSPATSMIVHPASTPARGGDATTPSRDSTAQLLDHFDRGVVTAFRRNQTRHKVLLSRSQSRDVPASNAISGMPYANRGPIKGGRLAAANSPITPMRKRKWGKSGSPGGGSPLAKGSLGKNMKGSSVARKSIKGR
ncbi:MAG: hypothetical protein M1819_004780 [Sarea resinae]|nr:MAG: hypothetical protein M1819_004780 [Sarea resinae]